MKYALIVSAVLSLLVSSSGAFAARFEAVSCWKGYNNQQQQDGLRQCLSQASGAQKCSTSMFEHGHAAFDACLMETHDDLHVVSCFKGFSQSEQNRNARSCLGQISAEQLCATSAWVHGHAAYDVCIME